MTFTVPGKVIISLLGVLLVAVVAYVEGRKAGRGSVQPTYITIAEEKTSAHQEEEQVQRTKVIVVERTVERKADGTVTEQEVRRETEDEDTATRRRDSVSQVLRRVDGRTEAPSRSPRISLAAGWALRDLRPEVAPNTYTLGVRASGPLWLEAGYTHGSRTAQVGIRVELAP